MSRSEEITMEVVMKGFGLSFLTVFFVASNALALGSPAPEDRRDQQDQQERGQTGRDAPQNLPTGRFESPNSTPVNLAKYDHLDPQRIVPNKPLEQAVRYYDVNRSKIKNLRYVTIVDFTQRASAQRMYVIDMSTGAVRRFLASAGRASDPDNDGWATKFSNTSGSNMTSLGFYLTGGLYYGGNGRSMYMHGLETSNSNAYRRAIVMHGADYVTPGWAGRSLGCPAIEQKYVNDLLPKLQGGSLMYHYYNQK